MISALISTKLSLNTVFYKKKKQIARFLIDFLIKNEFVENVLHMVLYRLTNICPRVIK